MNKLLIRLLPLLLIGALAAGFSSCKSQKKAAEKQAAAEYAAKKDKAKQDLLDILNDNTTMSLDQKEKRVAEIKAANYNDPEIDELIKQAEQKLADERSEMNRLAMEAKQKEEEVSMRKEMTTSTIQDYFRSIASASNVSEANIFIKDALSLFASPDVPVLIIINRSGDVVDYDRPTTILNYLNYLKDTKNDINKVDKVTYDDAGKIKELELIKMK